MSFAIYFESDLIDVSDEDENPFNPIKGKSLLEWLKRQDTEGLSFSGIEPEDWGWYCNVEFDSSIYMIGASMHEETEPIEWVFQISKERSLREIFTLKGKMRRDDGCLKIFENIFKQRDEFMGVQVE